jgi:hypothetical protein
MTARIKNTGNQLPAVVSTSKRARSIDQAQVAKALDTEQPDERKEDLQAESPPALFGLRQEMYQRLRSTGGRRSLEGAGKRQKIPLLEGDWERLQDVAEASQSAGVRPTPAQVASVLLHRALKEIKPEAERRRVAGGRKR